MKRYSAGKVPKVCSAVTSCIAHRPASTHPFTAPQLFRTLPIYSPVISHGRCSGSGSADDSTGFLAPCVSVPTFSVGIDIHNGSLVMLKESLIIAFHTPSSTPSSCALACRFRRVSVLALSFPRGKPITRFLQQWSLHRSWLHAVMSSGASWVGYCCCQLTKYDFAFGRCIGSAVSRFDCDVSCLPAMRSLAYL